MKITSTKTKKKKINKQDKRFRASERRIRRVIEWALSERRINLRAREICKGARISAPTFYLHCRGSDDALRSYEEELILEFQRSLAGGSLRREVIFMILLQFVAQNQGYFAATLVRQDAWLLTRMLNLVRAGLIGGGIPDKCFDVYAGRLKTLIFCWGKYEHFDRRKMALYVRKMMQTRVMDLGI